MGIPSRTKRFAAILVGAALVTSMAACSDAGGDTADQTLNFVTYTGGEGGKKYTDLAADFEAANPGTTVNIEFVESDGYDNLIKTRIQGGTAPDLFEILNGVSGLVPFVDAGLLTDLSDESWISNLIPAVQSTAEATEGKTYMMVSQISSEGVFYNKDIFDANGIDVPTTNDEFVDAVAELRANGVTPLGTGALDGWPLLLQTVVQAVNEKAFEKPGNETSAALVDGSEAYSDSKEWKAVLDDFTKLVASGAYDPNDAGTDFQTSAANFANGGSAMFVQGDFALSAIRAANPDLNLGYFAYPATNTAPNAVALNTGGNLAIPDAAAHKDLAKKFLDFLAQPDEMAKYLKTAVGLPSLTGIDLPDLDPALAEIVDPMAAHAVDAGFIGVSPASTAALQSGLQNIFNGTGDTTSVLAAMDAAE